MNIIGIVAEYNPFHKGHELHIRESKRLAGHESCVVVVMSGDFVQRGEASVFSKFARAEAACRCGADLVIELPLPWCLSGAETFADGAVALLSTFDPDFISFGSESGNLQELKDITEQLMNDQFKKDLLKELKEEPNSSYPIVRQRLVERRLGRPAHALSNPNDILAIEYMKSIKKRGLSVQALPIARQGAGHDMKGDSIIPSASEIRSRLRDGKDILHLLPETAGEVFQREIAEGRLVADQKVSDLLMMSRLRTLGREDFERIPDASNGLWERLYEAAKKGKSIEEIVKLSAAKQFTASRQRRACCCAVLGLRREDCGEEPPYARVLAFSEKGRALLHNQRGRNTAPLLTKPSHVKKLGDEAQHVFSLGATAHDFYTLMYPEDNQRVCGEDWQFHPAFVNLVKNTNE